MPSVLMIAYYFPPMGGAGIQRTLKFVKYLPESGWAPYVLTVKQVTQPTDNSLLDEISPQVPISRTSMLKLPGAFPWRLRYFLTRWFLMVDEQIGWLPFAYRSGKRIISKNQIKVIYSSSVPYTAHLVALKLQRKFNLPWVADFRDPWMGNPILDFPTRLHRGFSDRLEREIFAEADRVILNTEATRQYYSRKYTTVPVEKLVTVPNGYDLDDFSGLERENPSSSGFKIVHLGSLYQKTRSSKFFLAGLRKALDGGGISAEKIHVRFVGHIDKETTGLIDHFHLGGIVELVGYLGHREALGELVSADLLLLIPSYGVGSDLFVPGKLYEYLACRKPILCLADPGEAAFLVQKTGSGVIVPAKDINQIAEQLVISYQGWENKDNLVVNNADLIGMYERRYLTSRLANLFTAISEPRAN
jgi:glycosyltransferase involved in cell wall biosynthesis